MRDFFKYGALVLLGYVGYRYYSTARVAKMLNVKFDSIMANAINKNQITIGISINVTNKSNQSINVTDSKLKVYINGRYVGNAIIPYTQVISANSTSQVYLICQIYYKEVFAEWWNLFLQLATTVKLTVAGSLRFNDVYIPIPAIDIKNFTLSEEIKKITE